MERKDDKFFEITKMIEQEVNGFSVYMKDAKDELTKHYANRMMMNA